MKITHKYQEMDTDRLKLAKVHLTENKINKLKEIGLKKGLSTFAAVCRFALNDFIKQNATLIA